MKSYLTFNELKNTRLAARISLSYYAFPQSIIIPRFGSHYPIREDHSINLLPKYKTGLNARVDGAL